MLFATSVKAEVIGDTSFYVTVEKGLESDLNYGYFGSSTPVLDGFVSVNHSATWQLFTNEGDLQEFSSQTLGVSKVFGDSGFSGYVSNTLTNTFARTETWVGVTYAW
ncbi:uncharacterized protein METZ01_LOCUS274616 [marine metagenome]|uniref:Uncharacterized protein n=1 Tax=marine metagenome TaxID=408172 RepID=A0A382KEG6_9ZZZZ